MKKLIVAFMLIFTASNVFAETGKEIIETCVKSMKSDKLAGFKTQKISYTIKSMGQEIPVTIYKKAPDKIRLELTVGMKQVVIKNDTSISVVEPIQQKVQLEQWNSMAGKLVVYEADPAKYLSDSINFDLIGMEDFNNTSCYKIKVKYTGVPDDFGAMYIYIDAVSKWLLGTKMEMKDEANPIELIYLDMKKIDGAVYPSFIKVVNGTSEISTVSVDSWEANIDLDDTLFSIPQ